MAKVFKNRLFSSNTSPQNKRGFCTCATQVNNNLFVYRLYLNKAKKVEVATSENILYLHGVTHKYTKRIPRNSTRNTIVVFNP